MAAVLLVLAAAGAIWAFRSGGEPKEGAVIRAAPSVPAPTPEEKVEYFFRLFTSGAQVDVAGRRLHVWKLIGERALREAGPPALDALLSEQRYAQYRSAPALLVNVLRVLVTLPAARASERFYPFLLHWLEPDNAPPSTPGADWATDLRRQIFPLLVQNPDPRAIPACTAEFERGSDLRGAAAYVLLEIGEGGRIAEQYAALPPNESEPDNLLRIDLLKQLHLLAAPTRPERLRAQVQAFEPELRRALEGENAAERIYAAAVLLRTGDASMEARLLDEHRQNEMEAARWEAIFLLAEDRPDSRVRDICLRRLRDPAPSVGLYTAMRIYVREWGDEPEGRGLLWEHVARSVWIRFPELLALLIKAERPRVLDLLRTEIEGEDAQRRLAALDFAMRYPVREAGTWVLDLLQKTRDEAERANYFRVLSALRARDVIPILRAELADSDDGEARNFAAAALVDFHDAEGIRQVGALLGAGDEAALDLVFARAISLGPEGVPEAMLPALLRAVRRLPGEDARLKALFILRSRGRLEGVREGLVEAYRREPSDRVAGEIQKTLVELAHR